MESPSITAGKGPLAVLPQIRGACPERTLNAVPFDPIESNQLPTPTITMTYIANLEKTDIQKLEHHKIQQRKWSPEHKGCKFSLLLLIAANREPEQ